MLPTADDKYGVSNMAEAMKWVSVATSVVGVMTVPALGGIWVDRLLGTTCLFVILGLSLASLAECTAYWTWSRPKLAHANLGNGPSSSIEKWAARSALNNYDVEGESHES